MRLDICLEKETDSNREAQSLYSIRLVSKINHCSSKHCPNLLNLTVSFQTRLIFKDQCLQLVVLDTCPSLGVRVVSRSARVLKARFPCLVSLSTLLAVQPRMGIILINRVMRARISIGHLAVLTQKLHILIGLVRWLLLVQQLWLPPHYSIYQISLSW